MIEHVLHDGQLLAIIVPHDFETPGITFVTPPEFTQQLAVMRRPVGWVIGAHTHVEAPREVRRTQEVLVVRRGKVRVDLYDGKQGYVESRTLVGGDVILLVSGGHGFEILEDAEMIEVKQGPWTGDGDKVQFTASPPPGKPA